MRAMSERAFNVLFLCTGNSARSIMAECALNRMGAERFRGFSAGSHPRGLVHPLALELLRRRGYETSGLRSKSWNEFAGPQAPRLDFVITVCAGAAGEVCPVWPGRPATAHWSIEDPAACAGPVERQHEAFERAYVELESRIVRLVALPVESLDRESIARCAAEPAKGAQSNLGGQTRRR
jgi:protein-tyrosine-phosphatase